MTGSLQRGRDTLDSVVIGADPHKHSVTIEVVDERERILHKGRYSTDTDGYRQMLAAARRYPRRRWAVEGCNGIGRHVAQRLVADGESVVDVPAKLAARARVFDTGNGRKSDPADAHSVAVVALRTRHLTVVRADDELVALRLLVDRRDELGRTRTQTINRLHRLLLELIPGGAKRFLSAAQAQALLGSVCATDVAGRVRHQLATELLAEIVVLDAKMKASDKTLRQAVTATGTGLLDLYGIGPASAARILGEVAAGKTKMEALRALKRRLSDVVYRQLVADMKKASPAGHPEATTTSSAADPTPTVSSSDQSQPGLATEPTTARHSRRPTAFRRSTRIRTAAPGPDPRRPAPADTHDGPGPNAA